MKTTLLIPALIVGASLLGCTAPDRDAVLLESEIILPAERGPDGAPEGSCWGKYVSPAIIETVTVQVLVAPPELAADGTVLKAAIYQTETRQEIVRPRRERFFETLCQDALTPEFVASLQRALKARAVYRGPINGNLDRRTRQAVLAYQTERGLESSLISLETGRELGLVSIDLSNS